MTLTYAGESKESVLGRLAEHRRLDEIVQGTYWDNGRGCAVGCLTEDPGGGHAQFPRRWGVPVVLAYLIDELFERLPVDEAKDWPARVMGAIPVGVSLEGVWDRWCAWMLVDEEWGVAKVAGTSEGVVRAMGELFRRRVAWDEPTPQEWEAAAGDAWDTGKAWGARAARGAWDAGDAGDARAARGAWVVVAAWGARGAWDAGGAWAARDAWAARAAWTRAACDELVRLVEACE